MQNADKVVTEGNIIKEKLNGEISIQDLNKWDKGWKTVREIKKAMRAIDKLKHNMKEIYNEAIERLEKGDYIGLHVHRLSDGTIADDLNGIGSGRSVGRIIYQIVDGIIETIDVNIRHYK